MIGSRRFTFSSKFLKLQITTPAFFISQQQWRRFSHILFEIQRSVIFCKLMTWNFSGIVETTRLQKVVYNSQRAHETKWSYQRKFNSIYNDRRLISTNLFSPAWQAQSCKSSMLRQKFIRYNVYVKRGNPNYGHKRVLDRLALFTTASLSLCHKV